MNQIAAHSMSITDASASQGMPTNASRVNLRAIDGGRPRQFMLCLAAMKLAVDRATGKASPAPCCGA